MTIHLDHDLPHLASRHEDLLNQLADDPSHYIEEIPHPTLPRLVLKSATDAVVDETPMGLDALQALIDLMTIGALERCYFPGEARRVAYRLAGRKTASQHPPEKQRRIA